MSKKLIIQLDSEHHITDTVAKVLRLIEEGFTAGICPNWELVTDDDK